MGLLDELTALHTARPRAGGYPCRVAVILGGMSPEEREALETLLDRSNVRAPQIADTLQRNGCEVNASQIGHHRRRTKGAGCSCPLPEASA